MKIYLSFIIISLFTFFPFYLSAQSLKDYMAGNTVMTAKPQQDETPAPAQKQEQQPEIPNAMTVNHLPDIKLNNTIITKTVFNYPDYAELTPAKDALINGNTEQALQIYTQIAKAPDIKTEIKLQSALNAAQIYLQRRDYKQALYFADLAVSADKTDPSAQLFKIWVYAAQGKVKSAKKAADDLLFLTADFEYLASSKLAMAQAYFNAGKKKESMEILQNLYGTNPYIISHAVYLMGRLSFKDYKISSALFEQSLAHDGNNLPAQKYQAQIQYNQKQYVPAWQSYASLYILDNKDKTAKQHLKKLTKKLKSDPINYLFYTKLSELYTKKPVQPQGRLLKIGLYSNYSSQLTPIKSFILMPGADFTIEEQDKGRVISGEAYTPKAIVFDDKNQGIHIQNKWGAADFSTRKPFIIKLNKEGYSFLVKDVKADDIFAADLSDKELKGSLLVLPQKDGMKLINYTTLEDVLPSLLMSITRGSKRPALLEAAAIALRTDIEQRLNYIQADAQFDIPDNTPYIKYGGVNMQSSFLQQAVQNTKGKVLALPQNNDLPLLGQADIYDACSTETENGLKNTNEKINYKFSPINLFKFMFSNPPQDLYSAPQDPTLWSQVKWAYLIDLKEIQTRLNRKYKTGTLKYFEPAKITPQGRIITMRFKGSKKTVEIPFEQANFILAQGTLRSPFFTYIPFKKDVLFIGADTGKGKGLCIDGATGMARQGYNAKQILNYYYPQLIITNKWQMPDKQDL